MSFEHILSIVPGNINTDIFGQGISHFPQGGEEVFGEKIWFGAGGKSRNIAHMTAELLGKEKVAMIGRTSQDPYGLWKLPIDSLKKAGVNTDFVKILSYKETGKMPGIAFIPNTLDGQNEVYVFPGASTDFCAEDIIEASSLFAAAGQNQGVLNVCLVLPEDVIHTTIDLAKKHHLKIFLDPGGIEEEGQFSNLFSEDVFLLKPNQQEVKLLTGIDVFNTETAEEAAKIFLQKGVQNILITLGEGGMFFASQNQLQLFPNPDLELFGEKNATGCGDQVMATVTARFLQGLSLKEAVQHAVIAGVLQFHKQGIVPITNEELSKYL